MGNTLPVTRANFETMLSNPVCHRMFGPMRRERMGKMFAERESLSFGEMREGMWPGVAQAQARQRRDSKL